MAVKLSPVFNDAQLDSSGNPYVGAQLFTYAAGSTTKLTAYQDSGAISQHTNPIILNARGEPPAPIWLTEGSAYKIYLTTPTDSDPPITSVRVIDNVRGVNDATFTVDEWIASALTPTYVSATSFTFAGDQTSTFHIGRRLKTTNSGGTVYSTITNSVYGALTTITVVNDGSGVLDSGLSAVSYGILNASNQSAPMLTGLTAKGVPLVTDYVRIDDTATGAPKKATLENLHMTINGLTSEVSPNGANDQMAFYDASASAPRKAAVSTIASSGIRGYLQGGTISNSAGDPTNDIDVSICRCCDSTNVTNISLAAGSNSGKQLDAAWAAGSNQGMRDTGSIADGTWHIFVIKKDSDGVGDVLASTSASAPTMPAGYTFFRRIGSILRESGSIVTFSQVGDEFLRKATVLDVNANNPGASAVSRTLSVPTGIQVRAIVNWACTNASSGVAPVIVISALDANDEAPSLTAAPLGNAGTNISTGAGNAANANAQLVTRTNTSGQVRSRLSASDANVTLRGATVGWFDSRGRGN